MKKKWKLEGAGYVEQYLLSLQEARPLLFDLTLQYFGSERTLSRNGF